MGAKKPVRVKINDTTRDNLLNVQRLAQDQIIILNCLQAGYNSILGEALAGAGFQGYSFANPDLRFHMDEDGYVEVEKPAEVVKEEPKEEKPKA